MSDEFTLQEVQSVALAADMVIATIEGTMPTEVTKYTELGARMTGHNPWLLVGALTALGAHLLEGEDHRKILTDIVEFLSGKVE